MATEEYKSNSHKSKEQSQAPIEKKVEKVRKRVEFRNLQACLFRRMLMM